MGLNEYLLFLKNIYGLIPLKMFDYTFLVVGAIYVFEDVSFGLFSSLYHLIAILGGFFAAMFFYQSLSRLFIKYFFLTKGFSDALCFLLISVLFFIFLTSITLFVGRKIKHPVLPKEINIIGGVIFGTISYFFIASCVVALFLSFPVVTVLKDSVRTSVFGKFLASSTYGIEVGMKKVFGGAIDDTVNFLTIKPESTEVVKLNFTYKTENEDKASEQEMFESINKRRREQGVFELTLDDTLIEAAKLHATDMLSNGYFSHYNLRGFSPFDRLEALRVVYNFAGENLAFAPDGQIAMDGLMKSATHRENILSPRFKRIGVAVMDAGIYGKMFVQEFTD